MKKSLLALTIGLSLSFAVSASPLSTPQDASSSKILRLIKKPSASSADNNEKNSLHSVSGVPSVTLSSVNTSPASLNVSDIPAVRLASDMQKADDSTVINAPLGYLHTPEWTEKAFLQLRHHPQKGHIVFRSAQTLMTSGLFVDRVSDATPQENMPLIFSSILDPSETFISKEDIDLFTKDPLFGSIKDNPLPWGRHVVEHLAKRLITAPLPSEKEVHEKILHQDISFQDNKGVSPPAINRIKDPSPFVTHRMVKLMASGQTYKQAAQKVRKDLADVAGKIKSLSDEELMAYLTKAYVSSFDAHSLYLTGEETRDFRRALENAYDGFGFSWEAQQKTKIIQVYPSSPAEKAGLKDGDELVALIQDGKKISLRGKSQKEVFDLMAQAGNILEFEIISNPSGKNSGALTRHIKINRGRVSTDESIISTREILHKGKSYALIKIPSFYRDPANADRNGGSLTHDVRKFLTQDYKNSAVRNGVILDLRNNAGGVLDEAISLLGLFVDGGAVTQLKSSSTTKKVLSASRHSSIYGGPLVVLINSRSASASEMLSSALQDHGRAIIVGQQSFGKGTAQTVFDLDSLSGTPEIFGQINLTTMMFYRPLGPSLQKQGVVPDLVVETLGNSEVRREDAYKTALAPPLPLPQVSPEIPPSWISFLAAARSDFSGLIRTIGPVVPFQKEAVPNTESQDVQVALWSLDRLQGYEPSVQRVRHPRFKEWLRKKTKKDLDF